MFSDEVTPERTNLDLEKYLGFVFLLALESQRRRLCIFVCKWWVNEIEVPVIATAVGTPCGKFIRSGDTF